MIVVTRTNVRSYLKRSRTPLEILAFVGYVLIHLVCLRSLLEVYFSSTVVRDVSPLQWSTHPDARRLVLFVSDGLRADKFFELDDKQNGRAPFLRKVIKNEGLWGISHTQAPTESRSAHTAMLGGFYEDPSTIRALFRSNPVEFDTVLNESKESWCYGANDVIPFFNQGTAADHVHGYVHQYHVRRYAELDKWSFDMLKKLFEDAKMNADIKTRLHSDRIIFFLHLAGVDTNGHAFHPGSKQYLENIQEVDDIVKRTVDLFESYFEYDNKTAYIFTGDHGMTDAGGHGGDSVNETRTPFIAWGSGIVKQRMQQHLMHLKPSDVSETQKWGLEPSTRHDIQQIDVSVFMASLIGVPFPVNSVGKLPLEYFPKGHPTAEKYHQRARQLLKTLETKKNHIKESDFHIYLWPYQRNEVQMIASTLQNIEMDIGKQRYDDAIEKSTYLTEFAIKALVYYHKFSNHIPLLCTMLSIFGWIIFAVLRYLSISNICQVQYCRISVRYSACVIVLLVAFLLILKSFHSEWIYYVYVMVPIQIWTFLIPQIFELFKSVDFKVFYSKPFLCHGTAIVFWLTFIIQGFYNRKYFTFVAMSLAVLPVGNGLKISKRVILWVFLCGCLSVFPLLPDIISQSQSKSLIFIASVCGQFYCFFSARYHEIFRNYSKSAKERITYLISLVSMSFPGIVVIGLLMGGANETVALALMLAGWVLPMFCKHNLLQRLTVLNSLHIAIYILLSESYDAIFFVLFIALAHLWVVMDTESSHENLTIVNDHSNDRKVQQWKRICDDLRTVCVFVTFLAISFFSLYSIAGLNHFHPRTVPFVSNSTSFRLLLVFIYKILLRLLIPVFAFCTSMKKQQRSVTSHWYLISAIFGLIFAFFYLSVKTSGSWADIAISVVTACVPVAIPVATAVLLLIGKTMVGADSLQKIAQLPQEQQIENIKALLCQLRDDTSELISKNVGMRNIIRELDSGISQSDNDWKNVSYGDFVYQNKALKERLDRILDPTCNKGIQVGIVDENITPSKEVQTCNIKEAIIAYLKEVVERRKQEDRKFPRIATTWRPGIGNRLDRNDSKMKHESVLRLLSLLLSLCSILVIASFSVLAYYTGTFQLDTNKCEN